MKSLLPFPRVAPTTGAGGCMSTATHPESPGAETIPADGDGRDDVAPDVTAPAAPPPSARRWAGIDPGWIVVVAGFFAARLALWLAGVRFSLVSLRFPTLWHLLDPVWLKAHPLGPLWDQHTQPPVFNTVVGV